MSGNIQPFSQLLPYGHRLRPIPLPETHGFLNDIQFSSPSGHPDICLVQARYDLSCFHESLFSSCDLPAPEHLAKAVKKRRGEYLASRLLARHALCRLGAAPLVLDNDADRVPVWPAGFSGSLSHSNRRVALLLTSSASGTLTGVDCENILRPETAVEIEEAIVTSNEKERIVGSGLPLAAALTVAFSIKESLYKALYPKLRQYMDFSAAEIVYCSAGAEKIRLRLTAAFSPEFPAGREFTGWAAVDEEEILSWVIDSPPGESKG